MYETIHRLYFEELGRFPDLIAGTELNEKIQWLKLFDQDPDMVRCSDKIGVRDYVLERLGPGYVPDIYQQGKLFSDIDFAALPGAFVLKTNHDSGGVALVRDKSQMDLPGLQKRFVELLNWPAYGLALGEWG